MLEVSRDNIVEDCLQQLAPKSVFDLKMKLKVREIEVSAAPVHCTSLSVVFRR